MKKLFYIFAFLLSAFIFSAILPYPILSNHTNLTESVAYDINNFCETEIKKTENQNSEILPLKFEIVDKLLPQDFEFEIFDINSKLSFFVKRVGGTNHVDIQPTNEKNAEIISEVTNQNWTWQRRPVLVKLTANAYVPASLCAYPHGYGTTHFFNGHMCLHFYGSKTDGTKEEDFHHQKSVKIAQKQGKKILEMMEEI